ncbi:hypothetical protein FJ364_05135 [Candidatus Dependentiae bacterium]|nr:hypothetical protein [Candidatus Dependentiae bacterium]
MNIIAKYVLMSLAFTSISMATATASEGKTWVKNDQAVKLFDIFLRSNPITLYRIQKSSHLIKSTHAALKNVHKMNPTQEAEFVKAQLDKALELVKPFIDDIRGFKDVISPLLNESFASHGLTSHYLSDFPTGNDKLETFVANNIKTTEQLQHLLSEIQAFFADLFASLSPDTLKAYKEFIAKNSSKK